MQNSDLPVTDSYSYKGWLTSDTFIKRAMACLGYNIVAQLSIFAVILVAAMLFGVLATILK